MQVKDFLQALADEGMIKVGFCLLFLGVCVS